jgi:hypothetical protein
LTGKRDAASLGMLEIAMTTLSTSVNETSPLQVTTKVFNLRGHVENREKAEGVCSAW